MKYKPNNRPKLDVREDLPNVVQTKKGVVLMCPFCNPSHPLFPDREAACGTSIRVTAIQAVIPVRTVHELKLKCIKCGKSGGGEMIRFNNGYVHLKDCMPDTKLMTTPPEFSKVAQMVYAMPTKLRGIVEKYTGAARRADEIDPQGQPTGKTLGYFFYRT